MPIEAREAIETFARLAPATPILMVSLLKFNDQAAYPEDCDHPPCSGREAYARYISAVEPFLVPAGGEIVFRSPVELSLIGQPGEAASDWDEVVFVSFPSRAAFLSVISAPSYPVISVHRRAALARATLLQCG